MLFGKKHPISVTFIDVLDKSVIGQDEIPYHLIPIDFDFPTEVEIDGRKYALKAADPVDRKKAKKVGSMTVWVESVPTAPEEEASEEEDSEGLVSAEATAVLAPQYFRAASIADPQPRFSSTTGDYRFLEMLPSDWRALEFVQRRYAPEVGEELSHIVDLRQGAAVELDGKLFFSEQHIRNLTSLPLRSLELNDVALQTRFFPLATRLDGVAIMGTAGYVNASFAYRMHSGIGFYGQEIDNRLRSLGLLIPNGQLDQASMAEEIPAMVAMMAELELILVDWNQLDAVEPSTEEMQAFFTPKS